MSQWHKFGTPDYQKIRLAKAQTDDAVELAVRKVRVLCED
jgi:hypothetical protein